MNIKLAIRVSVFTILSVVISKAHACCQDPVASFSWQSHVPVYCGDEVTFTCTSKDADSDISSRSWSASGGSPATGDGSSFTTKWCSTGPKTVTLEVLDSDSSKGCPPDRDDDYDQEVTVLGVGITDVTSDVDEACVGCDIEFTATTSPADKYGCIEWSAPGGDPSTGSGEKFITNWDTPGPKTVRATGCSNFMDKQVTIVKVDSVTSNFNVRCIGCDITFTVTTNPPDHEDLVEWSAPGGDPSSQNGGATFTTHWGTFGTKTVTASCCDSSESKQATIVEVASVTSNKDTACVRCYVTFTATTNPAGYESLVQWSGGQSPATGSGKTFKTRWAIPDTKTVTASCCDSSKTKDVTIICPSGENTSLMSPPWDFNLARFAARLTPHSVDCSCISVREYVGGPGSDFCWFSGAEAWGFYPSTEVAGSTWNVGTDNWYGPDLIGWSVAAINFYRSMGRAPCKGIMIQDMRVIGGNCGSSYKQNQLEAHIGTTTLTSKRDGVSTTRPW